MRIPPPIAELIAAIPSQAIIAIDMPIGLPERTGPKGRAPERMVRPILGPRRSSVFSVPPRRAVMEEDYRLGCAIARANSDPPRAFSKQAFHIFPKIRELDALLRSDRTLAERIIEVHPELAFAVLNGGDPMRFAKKARIAGARSGHDERTKLLSGLGLPVSFADQPPRGAGSDDVLDALACLAVAARHRLGLAKPYPNPPERDAHGLPIAIWA